jgi:hypothetical protein
MMQQQQQGQQQQATSSVNIVPAAPLQPIQQQAYVYPAGTRYASVVTTYLSSQSMGLGITIVVCGVLAIIFNGVAIGVRDSVAFVGHGIWCGIALLITGAFGISAAVNKTKCPIITFMVLAIVTAVMLISLLSLGITGAAVNACSNECYGYNCYSYYYTSPCSDKIRAAVAMEALLAIIAVVAGIACIWGSAICCKAVCCCGYLQQSYGMPVVYSTPYAQGVTVYSQQQATQAPYYVRPQVMPGTISTDPPPYIPTGYTVQYWSQQQPTGQTFAYASAPLDPQMQTTSLNGPPAYNTIPVNPELQIGNHNKLY